MIRRRVGRYLDRIREELRRTFAEAHTPGETAGSFALGAFITMLPTLGLGFLAFVVIALLSDRVNRVALFASVVVFNPAVKWGVYVASFGVGTLILGPIEVVGRTEIGLESGPEVVARLLVGNLLFAVVAAVVSYVLVRRLAVAYLASEVGAIIDDAVEETVDAIIEP